MGSRHLLIAVCLATAPLVSAQSIQIDFGLPGTGPTSAYAAAGLHGHWNSFEAIDPAITYDLLDRNGQPTGATVDQFGGTEILQSGLSDAGDPQGADAVLLGDAMITHTAIESCLFFNGLDNGTYEVITYAWMPGQPGTDSQVHVDTNPSTIFVGGAWPGEHREGVTYARHIVEVTSGFLGPHSGVPPGGDFVIGAALNGIQIRKLAPEPPLQVSKSQLRWFSALDAVRYDVVRGDLAALRTGTGDFTSATTDCLVENTFSTSLPYTDDPTPGNTHWFLVRGIGATGNMTWDSGGSGQPTSRDAGINAAVAACS